MKLMFNTATMRLLAVSAAVIWLSVSQVRAGEVLNGSFEQYHPDPLGEEYYYEPDWSLGRPSDWADANDAWVLTTYVPEGGISVNGNADNWQVDQVNAPDGNSFLILDTDDNRDSYDPSSSYVTQQIDFAEGDRLYGQWFFGTYDYIDYSDYAKISLIPVGSGERIELLDGVIEGQFGVDDVGDYNSTEGWRWFHYMFDANTAGTYKLKLYITDVDDSMWPSVLAVDNVSICSNSSQADINFDCKVDMRDFSLLARWWMQSCNGDEPECFRANLDSIGDVDFSDLRLLALDWLEGS